MKRERECVREKEREICNESPLFLRTKFDYFLSGK